MRELIGPMYGFFRFIRNKNPMALSIDQYGYFFHALHHTEAMQLNTKEDLLRFTKIFWLNDPGFESQYNLYFNTFADWDKLISKEIQEENKTVINEKKPDVFTENKDERNTTDTSQPDNMLQPEPISSKSELVDFNIILKEGNAQTQNADGSFIQLNHNFKLSDQSIMPFDNRNLVQRLRRRVETSELVVSDQIDISSMIRTYTEHGYLDEIIYQLEDTSNSNIVFLADREGTMMAYDFLEHHFISGLKQLPFCNLEHYFFHNLPNLTSDENHYMLKNAEQGKKDLESHNHNWDKHTWFFIFSDAGANSGIVNQERIIDTLKFWRYLEGISKNIRWINPVPVEFMNDCTAKRLLMSVPMYDANEINLIKMLHEKS